MAEHLTIQCGPEVKTVPLPANVTATQASDILSKLLGLLSNPEFLALIATIMGLFQKTPTPTP